MAKNEFKLSYTAEDINNKLGEVEEHSKEIIDLTKDIDNLSVFITPQMFGAIGNGVNDDSNAIQNAFDNCRTGIVYFPPGRYRTTKKLVCQNPITIKMCRQYPCDYQKDHPYNDSENWMGARIETSSPDIGIVIGDGVCLDGFSIRAMPGFGGWDIIDYNTGMENDQNLIALEGTSGKGIVLQHDGTLGTSTYPSQVRFSHVRVDIAPLLQNGSSGIVPKNVYIIPECLFEFRPVASHNYIFEDIFLGQRHNRYCDNAFRTVIEKEYYRSILSGEIGTHIFDKTTNQYRKIVGTEIGTHILINIGDPWCNSVYIKNMCIEARCDYAINIINNNSHKKYNSGSQGHTAYGWVFEDLNIQAFDYIHKDYTGPLSARWKRYDNPLNRKYHKSLIKINGMEDLSFIGCCLHDVIQYQVEQGFSEGIFNIDKQSIHMIAEENGYDDINLIGAKTHYDKNEYIDNNPIQNITCVGCSQEFERIETYLSSKIQQIRKEIEEAKTKPSVENWGMSVVSGTGEGGVEGQILTLKDSYDKTISSFIPSASISAEMINTAVSAWMNEATTPIMTIGKNKIDEKNNQNYENVSAFSNCNVNIQVVENQNKTNLLFYKNGQMWTTHYIKVNQGDIIRTYTKGSEDSSPQLRRAYYVLHFKASEIKDTTAKDPYLPKQYSDFIKQETTVYNDLITINDEQTKYIRLVYMPYQQNSSAPNYGEKISALYPENSTETLLITINNENKTYEPYKEEFSTKLAGLLPPVSTIDNGKILRVMDGKWTAVSYPTWTTV